MNQPAKDGRETLQERLRARINKHIDPRGNVCVGQYNHWDSALDLDAIRDLDAAQAEIARLTAKYEPGHTDLMVSPESLDAFLADNPLPEDPAPLPVAEDVVERITDPIERIIADALLGANVPFTSEKSGTHRLDFGLGDGVFVEVKQFYTARADSALQKNENVILIQGRRAAERFASFLRQPEAAPEGWRPIKRELYR